MRSETYMSKINLQRGKLNSGKQEEQRKNGYAQKYRKQPGESVESVQEKKW